MSARVILTNDDYAARPDDGRRYELVVEVLSPSTDARDRGVKQALYERYAVPFYWIVDPAARTIRALRLSGSSYESVAGFDAVTPAALPPLDGLTLDPAAVWQ